MKKLPLNPNVEIFRWGPAPGKFLYESDFVNAIFDLYPKQYKSFEWSKTLFLFQDDRIFWINEFPALRKTGIKNFLHFMLNQGRRLFLRKKWDDIVRKILVLHKEIEKTNLTKLSDEELYQLGMKYYRVIVDYWLPTIPQELGNYGSDYLLKERLVKYITNSQELSKAMEILTAPEELSFYQQEEIELVRSQDISKHQQKYFWIHNSYAGSKVLPVSYFAKRKKALSKDIPQNLLQHLSQAKSQKAKLQKRFRIPKQVLDIAHALSYGVAWQDERKKYEFIKIHYKTLFLKEISRRKKYALRDLENFSTYDILQTLKPKTAKLNVTARRKAFGFFCPVQGVHFLNPVLAKQYWRLYQEEKIQKDQKEISGTVASKGKTSIVTSKIRIVLDPFKHGGFVKGDILVAPMTSPEYIFLMKKASAIVTDSGGLTSHAAIVSREIGVPCIVGTKVATKIFKNGDLVEVDATKGTIKKL